jgi:hypothetical protein
VVSLDPLPLQYRFQTSFFVVSSWLPEKPIMCVLREPW